MSISFSSVSRKRYVAVLAAGTLALGGLAVARNQSSAGADTKDTQVTYTCPIVGALTITETATDTPDPAQAGGDVALTFSGGVPTVPITVNLLSIVLELPLPAQVASVNSVTFSGGNVTGSSTVGANSVTLTFAGPVQSTAVQLPAATVNVTLDDDASGTINWQAPNTIGTEVEGLPGLQSCTIAAGAAPMQTTTVEAAPVPTTTTAPAPTTTVPAPTTTVPGPTTTVPGPTTTVPGPTTTVPGPTTTVPGPTTTVPGPTTTVAGPTTTVGGPTTTKPSGGHHWFLKLILRLLRMIFGIG